MGKIVEFVPDEKAKKSPMSMALFTIDEVCDFWPELEDMLDRVPHTWRRWTKESIYDAVVEGRMQVWGIGPDNLATLIIITMVTVFPSMRVLTLFWTAGEMTEEMPALVEEAFVAYARIQGCSEAEVLGRVGWEPIMLKHGFRRDGVMLVRPILSIHLS
jgi:hypothetical protein